MVVGEAVNQGAMCSRSLGAAGGQLPFDVPDENLLSRGSGQTEQRASSMVPRHLDLQAPSDLVLDKLQGLPMLQSTQQRSLEDKMSLVKAMLEELDA